MIAAQLHGKLASELWLSSEDLLTSAVFGSLKNLPVSFTNAVLAATRRLEGEEFPSLSEPLKWSFWPWWNTCEPDVVVEDSANIFVLEAKLYSDFGEDVGLGNQLRREWEDGILRSRESGKTLWLMAVTNHVEMPVSAITRQLDGSADADPSKILWMNWAEIGRVLKSTNDDTSSGWTKDLLELLTRMGLGPFDGFGGAVHKAATSTGGEWAFLYGSEPDAQLDAFGKAIDWAERWMSRQCSVWSFAGRSRATLGFRVAVDAARQWQREGITWRINLN